MFIMGVIGAGQESLCRVARYLYAGRKKISSGPLLRRPGNVVRFAGSDGRNAELTC